VLGLSEIREGSNACLELYLNRKTKTQNRPRAYGRVFLVTACKNIQDNVFCIRGNVAPDWPPHVTRNASACSILCSRINIDVMSAWHCLSTRQSGTLPCKIRTL
jgi:hypothetical protein